MTEVFHSPNPLIVPLSRNEPRYFEFLHHRNSDLNLFRYCFLEILQYLDLHDVVAVVVVVDRKSVV
jgi:hypothetical protein